MIEQLAIGGGIVVWQALVYGLPSLLAYLITTRRVHLPCETAWFLVVSSLALQALLGTFWTLTGLPMGIEPLVWLCCCAGLGIQVARSPIQVSPISSPAWLLCIVGITLLSRLVPAAMQSGLGQSDAYSHLQFGMELLSTGSLSNPVYPSAHAWIHTLPLQVFSGDPYLLYRYGGAIMALGLVLGIYFITRAAGDESAAICAGLLAAGCPLMLPLLRTGVGVFANQAGLLFAGLVLWAFPRNLWAALLAGLALACTVPMMLIDLAIPLFLYTVVQKKFVIAGSLAGIGAIGVGLVALSPAGLAQDGQHGAARNGNLVGAHDALLLSRSKDSDRLGFSIRSQHSQSGARWSCTAE